MNYIGLLQNQKIELENQIRAAKVEISLIRDFLASSKFTGTESDGARKDWISTADVNRLLDGVNDKLVGV